MRRKAMEPIRIMPCLDMKEGRVAKGGTFGMDRDAGADKVSMNSAAVKDPELVRKAAERFGKEKITIAIDGCRNKSMISGFEVVVAGGPPPGGAEAGSRG